MACIRLLHRRRITFESMEIAGTFTYEHVLQVERRRMTKEKDAPLTYTVPQAGRLAGLSRNGSYLAVERGGIPAIPLGRLFPAPAAPWDQIFREGRPLAPVQTKPRTRL